MKPCPFCGSHTLIASWVSVDTVAVQCEECGARGRAFELPVRHLRGISLKAIYQSLRRLAIRAWNKRAKEIT